MDSLLTGATILVTLVAISWYCRRSTAPLLRRVLVILLVAAAGVSVAVVSPDAIRLAAGVFREPEPVGQHRSIIVVVGRNVVLPAPPGFVIVGPELPDLLKNIQANVTNVTDNIWRVAALVGEEAHAKLVKGEEVELERVLVVDVSRRPQIRLGPEAFAKIKEELRKLADELRVATSPGEVFARMEKDAGRSISEGQRTSMTNGIRLPFHRDTERILAFSAVQEASDGTVVVTTSSAVLVGDVMITLRVSGSKNDLEWTRQVADQWAEAILAANARW